MKMTPKDQGSLMAANPYNKNKEWDGEGKTGKAFVSADDSMAYVSTQKTVVLDKMEEKERGHYGSTPGGRSERRHLRTFWRCCRSPW